MRTELTFAQLSRANRERCEQGFRRPVEDWSPTDWATAVAGEVGEACNLIQKLRRGETVDPNTIADELADAVMNIDLLCQRLGLDLGEAVRRKFNEVSRRVDCEILL
jgi:NTP pyrophosphatase (non-canonical NTP hydrolase)